MTVDASPGIDQLVGITRLIYRQALNVAADGLFGCACDAIAEPLGLRRATWSATHVDGRHVTEWGAEAGSSRSHAWQTTRGGIRHEITLTLGARGDGWPDEHLDAICATVLDAELLSHEISMRVGDAQGGDGELGHAVVDADGHVIRANPSFTEHMHSVMPRWDGEQLPFEIEWSQTVESHGVPWEGLFFYVARDNTLFQLRVRKDRRLPEITPREYQVISLIANGRTFKEIARELDMAPSTASTHLYKVYDKLGISRRSELVEWLKDQRTEAPA